MKSQELKTKELKTLRAQVRELPIYTWRNHRLATAHGLLLSFVKLYLDLVHPEA